MMRADVTRTKQTKILTHDLAPTRTRFYCFSMRVRVGVREKVRVYDQGYLTNSISLYTGSGQ